MPKKRLPENKGLPRNWTYRHGAYYYRVPKGQEAHWDNKQYFRLGTHLHEAHVTWGKRAEVQKNARKVKELIERYLAEVTPFKSKGQQRNEASYSKKIMAVFGELSITDMRPSYIYRYYDNATAKVSARREISLLRHAYTKAVEWGILDRHPFKNEVRLEGEKPRQRYVENWEIEACFQVVPDANDKGGIATIQAYIDMKLCVAARKSDILRIKMTDLLDSGVKIWVSKTKEWVIFEWSNDLKAAVQRAIDARPVDISPYLFCTKEGACFVNENGRSDGWRTLWDRFMKQLKLQTKVKEHFTDHDIRAKVGSDAGSDLEGKELLRHSNEHTTRRHYRRKIAVIKPAKRTTD